MEKPGKIIVTEHPPLGPIDVAAMVAAIGGRLSGKVAGEPLEARLFFDYASALPALESRRRGGTLPEVFLAYNPSPAKLAVLFDDEINALAEGFDAKALVHDAEAIEAAAAKPRERRKVETRPDGTRITTVDYDDALSGTAMREAAAAMKPMFDIHALINSALEVLPTPAVMGVYTEENGYVWASLDLIFGDAELQLTDEFIAFLPGYLAARYKARGWPVVEPAPAPAPTTQPTLFVPVAGDLITLVGGRAADIQSRLTRRGKKGVKSPEYQRALADNVPLVQPGLSNAGWPMLLYLVAYTTLAVKGEVGVYEGGDFVYVNRDELYEVIGAGRLDYRTRRAGLDDVNLAREYIAGYKGGTFYEYHYRPGGFLTRVVHIDETLIRENRRREFKAYMLHPLYWALIREAARRGAVKGGPHVLFLPVDRLDALLDNAVRYHDQNYAGLSRAFIDVLRNRNKRKFTRKLTTALELYGITSYEGRGAAALDAVRRKLDILGEADILAKYDLHDDSIILQPHAALSRGETKGLFENDE